MKAYDFAVEHKKPMLIGIGAAVIGLVVGFVVVKKVKASREMQCKEKALFTCDDENCVCNDFYEEDECCGCGCFDESDVESFVKDSHILKVTITKVSKEEATADDQTPEEASLAEEMTKPGYDKDGHRDFSDVFKYSKDLPPKKPN